MNSFSDLILSLGNRIYLVPVSMILLLSAGYLNWKDRIRSSAVCIFFAAFSIFLFAALLDPFLNVWDERFHALVAKNFIHHFFIPTLYDDPVLQMEYEPWDRFHIWLQKQPLFMWQMAISMKIFGVNELALRLPSVFNASLIAVAAYRSGIILFNKNTGFVAAILVVSSNYLIELVSGRQELDHNDMFFVTYISLSIWCFFEYKNSGKVIWVWFIGIFSGMAILCKWLVGLLVYLLWAFYNFISRKFTAADFRHYFKALFISFVIALPWQLYIFSEYFDEALHVYIENASHFDTVLHGHDGSFWYHIEKINLIYGYPALWLIIPAIIVFFIRIADKFIAYSILFTALFVYIFFTVAATKMPSFTAVSFLLLIIVFAAFLYFIITKINDRISVKYFSNGLTAVLLVFVFFYRLDVDSIYKNHLDPGNTHVVKMKSNTDQFKLLRFNEDFVICNVPGRHYIECMFYTGLPAYSVIPSFEQYQDLIRKGRKIVIMNAQHVFLPSYLTTNRNVVLIESNLQLSE